jgi:hypothetical protein
MMKYEYERDIIEIIMNDNVRERWNGNNDNNNNNIEYD